MSAPAVLPQLVGDLGTPELLIILVVVVLMFGSSKLPELARGSGRALRIFKAETKGLMDDEDDTTTMSVTKTSTASPAPSPTPSPSTRPVAEPMVAAAGSDVATRVEARRRGLAARQAELDAERDELRGHSA